MKKAVLIAVALLLLFRPSLAQSSQPTYDQLYSAVWQTIKDNFYDPSLGGLDWEGVRRKYLSELAKVHDDSSFIDLIYQMMRELKASHLELSPPRVGQSDIAIRTTRIGGRNVITAVAVASDAQRQGLRVGDQLLTASDMRTGQIGTSTSVRVEGCEGRIRTLKVRRENAWWPPEHPSLRWKSIEQGTGRRIGYIRIVRFDDDAAPLVDAAMFELRSTSALIIDLRDASGGNLSFLRLVSYLNPGPQLVAVLLTRAFLLPLGGVPTQLDVASVPRVSGVYTTADIIRALKKNHGGAAFYTENLGDKIYRGRILVLINGRTGSAAEGFAASVKNQKSITLIGQKTAGAVLGGERFTLPGGWVLTVPTHASWGANGKPYIDEPVTPNVETSWSRRDLCEGRDPDIGKALDLLDRE